MRRRGTKAAFVLAVLLVAVGGSVTGTPSAGDGRPASARVPGPAPALPSTAASVTRAEVFVSPLGEAVVSPPGQEAPAVPSEEVVPTPGQEAPAVPSEDVVPGPGEDVVPGPTEVEEVSERIFGPGATLALVHRRPPEQVLALLAPDAALPLTTATQARQWAEDALDEDVVRLPSALLSGQVGDWTLVLEDNGFRATDTTLLRWLSAGTTAVVVFQSANGPSSVQYAVDGRIVRTFDPVLYDNRSFWSGDRLPEEAGLTFEVGDAMADALRLAERLTGLRLTVDDVTRLEGRIGVGILI